MDFPLPIVACNIMIEYLDFYENVQVGGIGEGGAGLLVISFLKTR